MTSASTYLINHIASGIKVGDKVKVLREAESNERGWGCAWNYEQMDELVGTTSTITDDFGSLGFRLSGDFVFPYFVLEKV